MTTLKLYLQSPALSGTTQVSAVLWRDNTSVLRLQQTLFHPQGGGQKPDRGTIGGVSVLDVRHAEEGEVDHFIEAGHTLCVGDQVEMHVDEVVRSHHSRLHSAGHLIAHVACRIAPLLRPLAGHHWPHEARVEFECGDIDIGGFAERIQLELDDEIKAGAQISIVGDPFSARAVRIAHFEPIACGGTHVTSAHELAGLLISGVKVKNGRLRVSYTLEAHTAE